MKFIKVLALALFAAGSLGLSSCGCCTGEEPIPALPSLGGSPAGPVIYQK